MAFLICAALFLIPFVMGLIAFLRGEKDYFEEPIEDYHIEVLGTLVMIPSAFCIIAFTIVGIIELI